MSERQELQRDCFFPVPTDNTLPSSKQEAPTSHSICGVIPIIAPIPQTSGRMNRGNIPGFYYDEEKNKYFKITADHLVPDKNVKYSHGSADLQQRQVKKRKIEVRLFARSSLLRLRKTNPSQAAIQTRQTTQADRRTKSFSLSSTHRAHRISKRARKSILA